MQTSFDGEIWYWRGPSPYYFVTVPDGPGHEIEAMSAEISYGWGCIPATACIATTRWATSLIPKDGRYLVPIKVAVRRAERVDEGDVVTVTLTIAEEASSVR